MMDLILSNYTFSDQTSSDENSNSEIHSNLSVRKKKKESRFSLKMKRNTGKAYTTMKGKTVEARKCTPLESCKRRCNLLITQEETNKLFDNY